MKFLVSVLFQEYMREGGKPLPGAVIFDHETIDVSPEELPLLGEKIKNLIYASEKSRARSHTKVFPISHSIVKL